MNLLLALLILQGLPVATGAAWVGKAAFIGAFVLLVLLLIRLPPHLAGETGRRAPWWRRVRVWAILIALIQIAIYAWWG